ncbi:DUF4304 domain-containing protein [Stenotrophomonas maltophilia]|jgi:hypothetical protein|uniref:DUF4304 domain-containing protein n=1 Tax=Stenotrophomonas maltophilia TaxID=40324 RepID=UPI0007F92BA6|nr:DUF4304 domain-containing protein [Stenotrophomonas maltophilia]EKV1265700.1 DUF4304 domain-containing protein [Stenotrophomonas maltophilia]MBN4954455.1 DUF4304 domain-containing protein [Stenotrophomonas maltophilia]MCF3538725.1 DUF4304 domain-containing protein [Stenotrophomonas maltophilia]MCI1058537.1 DUF4304 domain-containing protein [Stenotrophomonas maltophilia]MCI1062532.1 DUF4304 domain-containing protein [Stenotrophomonas maltophilia]
MTAITKRALSIVYASLKDAGFVRSGPTFTRCRENFIDVLSPQIRSDGKAFALNVGVLARFIPRRCKDRTSNLNETDCDVRCRAAPPGNSDHWIAVEKDADLLRTEVDALLTESALPFFSKFQDIDSICEALTVAAIQADTTPAHFSSITRVGRALLAAHSWQAKADTESAKALATYELSICNGATSLKSRFRKILEA